MQLHLQEAVSPQARALRQRDASGEYRQCRVVVEHRPVRLVQLGIRQSRRQVFMERMDGPILWQLLKDRIRTLHPMAGRGGHRYALVHHAESPQRPALLQPLRQAQDNLSAPDVKDSLCESEPVSRSVGLRLSVPQTDETTIVNFRHLLERNSLGLGMLEEIDAHLESQGLPLREGPIVDSTIIEVLSSIKNGAGEWDPKMHHSKEWNQWHSGMKAHIGMDATTGLVHGMSTPVSNVHAVTGTHNLLYRLEQVVWSDAGYQGWAGERRTWGWRWNGRWRFVRGAGESWRPGAGRRWRRRWRHR